MVVPQFTTPKKKSEKKCGRQKKTAADQVGELIVQKNVKLTFS